MTGSTDFIRAGSLRVLVVSCLLCAAGIPGRAQTREAEAVELGVMTFNVLCSFCDRKNYDPWDERLDYFADIIERHDPDLIGLQEISRADEVGEITAKLHDRYEALYYSETEPKPRDYPDATILYRAGRFELLDQGYYWLSATPDEAWSRGWAAVQFWRLVGWARLRDRATGRELYFSNTHFDNNTPNQENSAPLLLGRVAPFAETMPCIVVGDFNSKPASRAYGILDRGIGGGGFSLINTYDLAAERITDAGVTPPPPYDADSRIDHMWVAGPTGFEVKSWTVDLRVYGAKDRPPSDHKAMAARIVIKPRQP